MILAKESKARSQWHTCTHRRARNPQTQEVGESDSKASLLEACCKTNKSLCHYLEHTGLCNDLTRDK